jgi:hypothetical protein
MTDFVVALRQCAIVRPTDLLVDTVGGALEPIVSRAGKSLRIWRSTDVSPSADLEIVFVSRAHSPVRLGEQFIGDGPIRLILGDEGGGSVYVGTLAEMRVGGRPEVGLGRPGTGLGGARLAYAPTLESVFVPGEREFAMAAANIALHEAGHMIAALEHSRDMSNYMVDGHAMPSGGWRTRANLRWFWSSAKTYSEEQARRMADAIEAGHLLGGSSISVHPAGVSPGSTP